MKTLSIPYFSQILPGALEHNNDCGAASTLMLLKAYGLSKEETVDQVYNRIQPAGDMPLSAGGMQNILAAGGITNKWMISLSFKDIFEALAEKRPLIALIHYAPLVQAGLTEKTGFRGAHFVVLMGIDIESVCIHDPYTTGSGEAKEIPLDLFAQAWGQCNLDGNPNNAAIIMTLPLQDLSQAPAAGGDEYRFGVYQGRPVNGLNVRSGPGSGYAFICTLWKAEMPAIHIEKISGDWGCLADKNGWVYMPYLVKV